MEDREITKTMKTFGEWMNELELDLDVEKPAEGSQRPPQSQQRREPNTTSRETGDAIEVTYEDPEAKGYIHAQKDGENPGIYRVVRVTATPQGKGYGKILYRKAMEMAAKRGAVLAPAKNSTSDSAINVWKSLYNDPTVKKSPLQPKDWPDSPRNHRMMAKYPDLRFRDPQTYPPKTDAEFWSFNSGYGTRAQ